MRELKLLCGCEQVSGGSRTFTGAWIETLSNSCPKPADTSHLHGCVNWNVLFLPVFHNRLLSHLHGCVNWNTGLYWTVNDVIVAPSRVRELKLIIVFLHSIIVLSHLHGCVNWNFVRFTTNEKRAVAPSRVRELKLRHHPLMPINKVAPSRVRELKRRINSGSTRKNSRTFTGAWIETVFKIPTWLPTQSHLHGCVNWNLLKQVPSHLHGCVNWNTDSIINW